MPPAGINVDQLVIALTSKQVTEALGKIFDDLLSTKISKLETEILSLSNQLLNRDQRIQQLENENASLRLLIDDSDQRVEQLEAYSRIDNLIIHGIPETYAECTSTTTDTNANTENSSVTEAAILKFFNEKLNVNIRSDDISVCHRLKKINKKAAFKPIIVRFTNRKARSAVLAAKKTIRDRNDCKGIYINEHLTTTASKLFNSARQICKDKKINSAWSWNGRIFIKLLDGHTIKNISSLTDLDAYM
jgi:hypothetical protein